MATVIQLYKQRQCYNFTRYSGCGKITSQIDISVKVKNQRQEGHKTIHFAYCKRFVGQIIKVKNG